MIFRRDAVSHGEFPPLILFDLSFLLVFSSYSSFFFSCFVGLFVPFSCCFLALRIVYSRKKCGFCFWK
ncbi:hypothetical protein V8C37DRAFT_378430 [Trichoderma ceciliae]